MEVIDLSDVETYDADDFLKDTEVIELSDTEDENTKNIQTPLMEETEMAYFTKNLGVPTVIYTTVPIEYPATSPDGVATVFSIQGWKNHMDAFHDVQYSVGGGGGSPFKNVLSLVTFLLQNMKENVKASNIALLPFKHVRGDINEFEINSYDSYHKLILSYCHIYTNVNSAEDYHRLFITLFDVIKQLTGKPVQFKHINNNGWGCILGDLDLGQMKGLGLALHDLDTTRNLEEHLMNVFKSCHIHFQSDTIKEKIKSLLKASSQTELEKIFLDIEKSEENGIEDWINYYQKPYILASLNPSVSLMDSEIWNRYGNDTNAAESAHALVNRTGKQLKLLTAILRGRKFDERNLQIMETQDHSSVPYTRRDKSQIKRQALSINRKGKRNQKGNEDTEKISLKRKPTRSTTKKALKIQPEVSENDSGDDLNSRPKKKIALYNEDTEKNLLAFNIEEKRAYLEIEIEERKMNLKERNIALRKAEAEVKAIELANEKTKLSLEKM